MQAYFAHWLETEHFNLGWRDPKGGELCWGGLGGVGVVVPPHPI